MSAAPHVAETRRGGIAILTLSDPEKLNCLSLDMRSALLACLRRLDRDPEVRVIVLTGADGNFCAGGDISSMHQAHDIASARTRIGDVAEIVRLLATGSKPVIAAVEGWAVGAGLSLCMLCDTVIASESARFKGGFGAVGLVGDMGILHTLPARIGVARAKTLLFYGREFDASTAASWGLVDAVVRAGGALDEAIRWAVDLEAQAPLPIAMARAALAKDIEDVLAIERDVQSLLLQSLDHAEGRTAFLEKRKPKFTGR